MNFSRLLIHWYLQHKRDLPWRHTNDPYLIWLSEIMLQQTRVAQGLPYYLAFSGVFPTVFELASAEEQQVLRLWQGLGYYSRARNLHATAKYVASELGGDFPRTYSGLLKLRGIGEYTAAAIASFAYNENVPVVDGNVYRVLARYFDVETDIAGSNARKKFTALATELLPTGEAAVFNQAMMEFGALQCVPRKPDCGICPMNEGCLAFAKGKVSELPVKSKKAAPKPRYFNYLVLSDDDDNTVIQKRTGKGIWQNLYEFPLIEADASVATEQLLNDVAAKYDIDSVQELPQFDTVHKLSHQHLHIRFRKIRVRGKLEDAKKISGLSQYPFPIVLFNFIEKHWK